MKIAKREHAFQGYANTCNVKIWNAFNPELQLEDTVSAIKSKLIELLTQLKGFKFLPTLVSVFKEIESDYKTKYEDFYSSSKAEIIINKSGIDNVFQSIYTTIITDIQISFRKGSGWIIDSVIDHTMSISKYNPLAGSSSIKLLKELDHLRKGLINIQNSDDNECFKWCLARFHQPEFHQHYVFVYGNKERHRIYVSKQCCEEKYVDLLLIGEREKNTMFLSKILICSCMIIH